MKAEARKDFFPLQYSQSFSLFDKGEMRGIDVGLLC